MDDGELLELEAGTLDFSDLGSEHGLTAITGGEDVSVPDLESVYTENCTFDNFCDHGGTDDFSFSSHREVVGRLSDN